MMDRFSWVGVWVWTGVFETVEVNFGVFAFGFVGTGVVLEVGILV
jgi:hypothetical protein